MVIFASKIHAMSKKLQPYFWIVGVIALIILALTMKEKLNNLISEKMQQEVSSENKLTAEEQIQSRFNYAYNRGGYEYTFLEFSSTDCAICKQMEPVLEAVKNSEKVKVNVVFLHIMKSENLELMKYYGISAVPMQILLDDEGKEFFRHYGFISSSELESEFLKNKNQRKPKNAAR